MSISEMPPVGAPAAPPAEDEALITVIVETMVTALPELIKQDPAFKAAVLDALGMSAGSAPKEGEDDDDDLEALLGGEDEGGDDDDLEALLGGEDEGGDDEDIDALLMSLEDTAPGDDIGGLGA